MIGRKAKRCNRKNKIAYNTIRKINIFYVILIMPNRETNTMLVNIYFYFQFIYYLWKGIEAKSRMFKGYLLQLKGIYKSY